MLITRLTEVIEITAAGIAETIEIVQASKNNNNRNKKPHYIKGKKNNFFDNIILDN